MLFPVFICYVQCFSEKTWFNHSFDNFEWLFWCTMYLLGQLWYNIYKFQICYFIYNLSIILWRKKLSFWNTGNVSIKLLQKWNSLSQKRSFNHSKCLKFLVCERFYKHFFKTSKDSKILMIYYIETCFTLRYF